MDIAIKIVIAIVIIWMVVALALVVIVFTKPDFFSKYKDKVVSAEDAATGNAGSGSSANRVGDTKSFVPVESFEDYAMSLGGHNYRAIIECSSVNYSLMSMQEQDMVEKSFMRFLNSISFPIELYVQTREYDIEECVEKLHDNIKSSLKRFPSIKEYANKYEEQMRYLTDYIGNSKVKKKYIIVPFNSSDLLDVSALNNYEIKEFALEELMGRCQTVMGGISGVGLKPVLLDRKGIAECLYSYYHRDTYRIAQDILSGDFTSLVVKGKEDVSVSDREKLDVILSDAQNRINNTMITNDSTSEELVFYRYIWDVLESFKQNDRGESMLDLLERTWEGAKQTGDISVYNAYLKNRQNLESNMPSEYDIESGNISPVFPYVSPDVTPRDADSMGEMDDYSDMQDDGSNVEKSDIVFD